MLNLANVSQVSLEALLRIQIPQLDSEIVRGREYGAGCGIDAHVVDPVGMASQSPSLLGVEIENLDRLVDGPRSKLASIEMDRQDAIGVALKSTDALACVPVPNLDSLVKASADQLAIVELQSPNRRGMST